MTVTNGSSLRRLCACKALATSSLPVPDSPVMSTVASVGATVRIMESMLVMAGERPRISVLAFSSENCLLSSLFSTPRRECSMALLSVSFRASKSSGLMR